MLQPDETRLECPVRWSCVQLGDFLSVRKRSLPSSLCDRAGTPAATTPAPQRSHSSFTLFSWTSNVRALSAAWERRVTSPDPALVGCVDEGYSFPG